MLRKILTKFYMQWDKALPYILFAYPEMPTETTGLTAISMSVMSALVMLCQAFHRFVSISAILYCL